MGVLLAGRGFLRTAKGFCVRVRVMIEGLEYPPLLAVLLCTLQTVRVMCVILSLFINIFSGKSKEKKNHK